ncbi:MAG: fumarate hydratase [Planctomycetes bacterium]|jgi:fumarate hydratase class I|nr:fumarate hydratase [Planctomycetota bacterium]
MALNLTDAFLELIRRASSDLPPDVERALVAAHRREEPGSVAKGALAQVLLNVKVARESSRPLCQDTGTNIYHVHLPASVPHGKVEKAIVAATRKAVKLNYLRPNAVDSVTGKNSGDNTGVGQPQIHFEQWGKGHVEVSLMLKGGGCENVGRQYAVPDAETKAGRDLEGVRRVVIDAVQKAQGLGCAPGSLGIAIGGDRGSSYLLSKQQFLRSLDDRNPDRELAALEKRLLAEINELGIGPMGFGGKTTVLTVKIGKMHRLPASFFVSISYMCWAFRRARMTIRGEKVTYGY